jgi:hypothetical protein
MKMKIINSLIMFTSFYIISIITSLFLGNKNISAFQVSLILTSSFICLLVLIILKLINKMHNADNNKIMYN